MLYKERPSNLAEWTISSIFISLQTAYSDSSCLQSSFLSFRYANHWNRGTLCFSRLYESLIGTLVWKKIVNKSVNTSAMATRNNFHAIENCILRNHFQTGVWHHCATAYYTSIRSRKTADPNWRQTWVKQRIQFRASKSSTDLDPRPKLQIAVVHQTMFG